MVKDADTLQGIANALIHVRNITRIAKSFRRSDDINHDITSVHDGKYIYNLFVTSNNESSNSPIHESKVLHKSQTAL